MNHHIMARQDYAVDRFYPLINGNIYEEPIIGKTNIHSVEIGRFFLLLGKRELNWRKRVLGWKLDPYEKTARMFHFHKLAVHAEIAEKWKRAEFFWDRTYNLIKRIINDKRVWTVLLTSSKEDLQTNVYLDENILKKKLLIEFFIDTHYALYNGLVKDDKNEKRKIFHVKCIEKLASLINFTNQEQLNILEPVWKIQLQFYEEKKIWDKALRYIKKLIELSPDNEKYQNDLVNVIAYSTLSRAYGPDYTSNIEELDSGINTLGALKIESPWNLLIYEQIGALYFARSVQLSNDRRLSEALVDVQKAITYSPFLKEAEETMVKFIELMEQLQHGMKELLQEISSKPELRLNESGMKMQREATMGFDPLNRFIASLEFKQIEMEVKIAFAHDLWKAIGLSEPDDLWDEKANALSSAVTSVLSCNFDNMNDITQSWERESSKYLLLEDLDHELVCSFIYSKLMDEDFEATKDTGADSSCGCFPIILTKSDKSVPTNEPLDYWFFSKEGRRVRWQVVIAVIVAITVGLYTVNQNIKENVRNNAYEQIMTAYGNKDFLKVIETAEDFFSSQSITKNDIDLRIKEFYTEAFVRWFLALDDQEINNHSIQFHIDNYRKIIDDKNDVGG